jgi:hypothetical protein
MVLGTSNGLTSFLYDTSVVIDRENHEIVVHKKLFGRKSEKHIPMDKVNSVRFSTRHGTRNLYSVGSSRPYGLYEYPKTRYDVWIDAMELGKVVLVTHFGFRAEAGDINRFGQFVADYLRKPFFDTSKS